MREGLDVLRVSEAANDKQEIDRITFRVANFSLDFVVEFRIFCRVKFREQIRNSSVESDFSIIYWAGPKLAETNWFLFGGNSSLQKVRSLRKFFEE
jgi:hypothetical protein